MDISRLRAKAAALGFSFERGVKNGAGYVLINDAGDKPLGHGYTASLADIDGYLDSFADDAGIDDVEIGSSGPSRPPLTKAEEWKALQDHPNADKIEKVLEPPASTRQEQRARIALDRLVSIGMDVRSSMAFDHLSETEKQQHYANVRAARLEEERIKAAKLPKKEVPLRTIGLDWDTPLRQEEARRGRVHQKADRQLFRTNQRSIYDRSAAEDESCRNLFGDPAKEKLEMVRAHREYQINSPPPESGEGYAPKAPCKPVVEKRRFNLRTLAAESRARAAAEEAELESELAKARIRVRAKKKAERISPNVDFKKLK